MAEIDDKAALEAKIRDLIDAQQDEYDLQVKLNEVARNNIDVTDQRIKSTDDLISNLREQAVQLAAYLAEVENAKGKEEELTQVKQTFINKLNEEIKTLKEKDILDQVAVDKKQQIIDAIKDEKVNVQELAKAYEKLADEQAEQNDALKAARALNE